MTRTAMTIPMRLLAALSIAMALLVGAGVGAGRLAAQPVPGGAAAGPLSVGAVTLTRQRVPMSVTLPGVAVAIASADIRPLVQGVVQKILYQPDQQMTTGAPMFQIDPTRYDAAVAVAEANLASATAALTTARSNAERYNALAGRGVTEADAEAARSELLQAEAAVAVAEANLKTAEYEQSNTVIRSPIDGQASVAAVSVGDLVTAGQAEPLVSVTALDPIYADLADTSARMLQLRDMMDQGVLQRGAGLDVVLILENGHRLEGKGRLVSVGDQVSTGTGTFNVRVEVPNPGRRVLPGMFVQAQLTFGLFDAILVPQMAATPNADGTVSVWLAQDGRAVERRLVPQGSTRAEWIVTEGLDEGTVLLVDSRDDLRAGAEVAPRPVTIATGGIVTDRAAASSDAAAAPAAPARDAPDDDIRPPAASPAPGSSDTPAER